MSVPKLPNAMKDGALQISQEHYIKYNLQGRKTGSSTMDFVKLVKEDGCSKPVDATQYMSIWYESSDADWASDSGDPPFNNIMATC